MSRPKLTNRETELLGFFICAHLLKKIYRCFLHRSKYKFSAKGSFGGLLNFANVLRTYTIWNQRRFATRPNFLTEAKIYSHFQNLIFFPDPYGWNRFQRLVYELLRSLNT